MNSLEFIDKEIKNIVVFLEIDEVLYELSDNDYKFYNDRLKTLQQIKTELEAWEVAKKNIVIDITGSLYTIQIYKQDEECKIFEKALEIKDE